MVPYHYRHLLYHFDFLRSNEQKINIPECRGSVTIGDSDKWRNPHQ
jgi:hypothetical protein